MTKSDHAPLSPSASKRWIECPGSFAACEGLPEGEPSEAALEGTECHKWAEKLRKACSEEESDLYGKLLLKLERQNEEMAFHCDNYIEFLDTLKTKFQSDKYVDYEEYLENRIQFTKMIWGTLDFAVTRKSKIGRWQAIISDLKYGRGVYVPVLDNTQLIIYLICLENYLEVRFEKAWVYIYQPRIPKDKPYEMMMLLEKDITKWRMFILEAEYKAVQMRDGEIPLEFKAGDHCRFCPAQIRCETFKEYTRAGDLSLLEVQTDLPDIKRIPVETLIEIHKKKKQIEAFLQNVDHFLLMRGMKGKDIGDLKIVEGRSSRKWLDDVEKVAKGLAELGAKPYTKKLITIGKAEKIIGKNKIDHLTIKPPGKIQLAQPEDDRPKVERGRDALALLDIHEA